MRTWAWTLVGGLAWLLSAGLGRAQQATGYEVNPQAGPWMICAASFTGDEAQALAVQMVQVLRQRDHLPAYIFNHADQERQRQRQEYEELCRRNPGITIRPRFTRVQEQCAVMIGGFATIDKAKDQLPRIKTLPPPDLRLKSGQPAYDTLVNYTRTGQENQMEVKRAQTSPFTLAFVARNPTIPPPPPEDRHKDELAFLRRINANEDYNLFKCRGKYTLLIKEYAGVSMIQTEDKQEDKGFLAMLGLGGKSNDVLSATAMQAHELARFLRQYNFDTYVLHTRTGSLVTVGSYEGPEDEKLKKMQQQLASMRFQGGAAIELLPTPLPMPVPR